VEAGKDRLVYRLTSPTRADLVFERFGDVESVEVVAGDGREMDCGTEEMPEAGLTVMTVRPEGDFAIVLNL
jgi:hypothetical protein